MQAGERIDHYEVLGEVGRGAMGIVVRAHDTKLGREVALKVLRRQSSHQGDLRLLREARAMARLAHANVVKVHAVGNHNLGVYIAMEFVRGTTLASWWFESKPDWQQVLDKWLQAGAGLAAAHAKGVIHRDFKPENVLVSEDGRVLVTDFGLAGFDSDDTLRIEGNVLDVDASLTQTGFVLGTPRFMAPEMFDGRRGNAHSDQFAFGVSLCHAVYGEFPFEGGSLEKLRHSVAEGPPRDAPAHSEAPEALWPIIRRSLALHPRSRHRSVKAMVRKLHRVVDGRHERRRTLALTAVAAAGATLGTALVLALDPRPAGHPIEATSAIAPHLRARALLARASIALDEGRVEEAERYGQLSSSVAAGLRSNELDAEIALFLSMYYARTMRLPESRAQLEAARVAIRRLGDPPQLRIPFAINESWMQRAAGHHEEAAATSSLVLEMLAGTKFEGSRAAVLQDRAGDFARLRRFDEAMSDSQAACDVTLRAKGKNHPDYISALQTQSEMLLRAGRHTEADENLRKAIALAQEGLDDSDLIVAALLYRLAANAAEQDQPAEAKKHLEQAIVLYDRHDADGGWTANTYELLGRVCGELGEYEVARGHADKALAIARERLGPDEPALAHFVWTRGEVEFQAKKHAEALPYFRRSAELVDASSPYYRDATLRIALSMVELDDPETLAAVDMALEVTPEALAVNRAVLEFTRARMLMRRGEKQKALEIAVASVQVLAADPGGAENLAEVREWLAVHR